MKKDMMLDKHEYRMAMRALGLLRKILPKTPLNHFRILRIKAVIFECYKDKNLAVSK